MKLSSHKRLTEWVKRLPSFISALNNTSIILCFHNARLNLSPGTKSCLKYGKGTKNIYDICHGCGSHSNRLLGRIYTRGFGSTNTDRRVRYELQQNQSL